MFAEPCAKTPFIPSAPVLKRQPPTGSQWLHEVKLTSARERSTRGLSYASRDRGYAPAVAVLFRTEAYWQPLYANVQFGRVVIG